MRFFRADAAYAVPALYERLEEAGCFHAIRMKKNAVLEGCIAHRLTRPVGRPSKAKVKRFYEEFQYHAASGTGSAASLPRSNGIRASCFHVSASSSPTCRWSQIGWCGSTASAALPSSKSRKASMPFAGRSCHADGSATMRFGCNSTRWPTTWPPSSAASSCPRPWQTGR